MLRTITRKGSYFGPRRKETSPGDSLVPLDQLSAAPVDDLERDADLLGQRYLFHRTWPLHALSFFPGFFLQPLRHFPTPRRRHGLALPDHVVLRFEWRELCCVHH